MNNTSYIGIDLGTANTLVYTKTGGIILREPSVVAYEKETSKILAVGSAAKKMLGKTPNEFGALYPLRDGVIAEYELCTEMLSHFIKKANPSPFTIRPRAIVSIPHEITEVERRAVIDSVTEAGASGVILIEESLAAALGAGLPVLSPKGSLVVDIGGGTTEIAVVSSGGTAQHISSKIAGNKLRNDIISYIKREFNVLIGDSTADEIKIAIGSAHKSADTGAIDIKGRNMRDGKAAEFTIYSGEVREAMEETILLLFEEIRSVLDSTSPELCADIYDTGITLCGGGASLSGLDLFLSEKSGLPVKVAKNPLDCVINGIAMLINDEKSREQIRGLELHR